MRIQANELDVSDAGSTMPLIAAGPRTFHLSTNEAERLKDMVNLKEFIIEEVAKVRTQ